MTALATRRAGSVAARTAWQQALAILDDLHHLDADRLRTRLRDSNQADP
jgi:hypothetical protein